MEKITAIGEILFDIYPDRRTLGGAPFNFIYHMIKLTGSGNFISAVGNDEAGKEIINFITTNKINENYIQIKDEYPTGAAIANLDENKIPHWEIRTGTAYDFISQESSLQKLLDEETDCLYFGTLAQRAEISRDTIQSLLDSQRLKLFCDLNIRQNYYSKEIIEKSLSAANVLKLNIDELKLVNDLLINKPFDIVDLSKTIADNYNTDLICVTMGEDGSCLISGNDVNIYNKKLSTVVDTVGAGDAFAAILCLGYLRGWNIERINKLSSEFAAGIVMIEGALPKDDTFYKKFKGEFKSD